MPTRNPPGPSKAPGCPRVQSPAPPPRRGVEVRRAILAGLWRSLVDPRAVDVARAFEARTGIPVCGATATRARPADIPAPARRRPPRRVPAPPAPPPAVGYRTPGPPATGPPGLDYRTPGPGLPDLPGPVAERLARLWARHPGARAAEIAALFGREARVDVTPAQARRARPAYRSRRIISADT